MPGRMDGVSVPGIELGGASGRHPEQWPILERQDESGQWRSLGEAGFPAGLPRMMLR